jgi:hypothetical protein
MSEMSTDYDAGLGEPITGANDVIGGVQQNLTDVRREITETKSASSEALMATLNDTLQPLAEEVGAAPEYSTLHGAATAYLTIVRLFVLPHLHEQRRERVRPSFDDLDERLGEFRRRHAPRTPDQLVFVAAIAEGLEVGGRLLAARLEQISNQIGNVHDAVQSLQGSSASGQNAASLSSIDSHLLAMSGALQSMAGLPSAANQSPVSLPTISSQLGAINTTLVQAAELSLGLAPPTSHPTPAAAALPSQAPTPTSSQVSAQGPAQAVKATGS